MAKALIFAVCVALFVSADASVKEAMQIRIFNPNFSGMSSQELQTLIERANLTSLGYKKITETKTETDFETGLEVQKEAVRYLKEMRCDQVAEAEEKLQSLFPEALSDDVSARVKSEIQSRNIKGDVTCITGIEFHLKACQYRRERRDAKGQDPSQKSVGCGICIGICISLMLPSL